MVVMLVKVFICAGGVVKQKPFTRFQLCRGMMGNELLSVPSLGMLQVFVLAMVMLSLVTGHIQIHSSDREFRPLYLLKRSQAPRKYATSLLVQNSSGESSSGVRRLAAFQGGQGGTPYCMLYVLAL